jgi:hypothetical protein
VREGSRFSRMTGMPGLRCMCRTRAGTEPFGVSVAKRHRESKDKIDLAVCMIGAGLARRVYLNTVSLSAYAQASPTSRGGDGCVALSKNGRAYRHSDPDRRREGH